MNSEQIADNVKRLRGLDAKRTPSKFTIRVKETWDESALVSFHSTMDRAVEYGNAIQTINALVQLVGEMRQAMQTNTAQCSKMHHGKKDQNHEDFGRCPPVERYCDALTKSAPIAALAKGDK